MGILPEVELELDDLSLVLSDIDDVVSRVLEYLVKAGKNTCPAGQLRSRDR